MGYKLMWMKWWPHYWLSNTNHLSAEAKALWIDVICLMWDAPERGRISLSIEAVSRLIKTSEKRAILAVSELVNSGVCDSVPKAPLQNLKKNSEIILISRRILREEKARKNDKIRKRKPKGYETFRVNSDKIPANSEKFPPKRIEERGKMIEERRESEYITRAGDEDLFQYLVSDEVGILMCNAVKQLTHENYRHWVGQFWKAQIAAGKYWNSRADARGHLHSWLTKQDFKTPARLIV